MKPVGSRFEYTEERDKDLIRAYREQISLCQTIHLPELLERTVNSPSNRFWVSEGRAAIVISEMMRGNKLEKMNTMKREMFLEIYSRVLNLQYELPALSIAELVWKVINQPAPKFYITPGSAKVIIHKIKKKWYEERMQRLRRLF